MRSSRRCECVCEPTLTSPVAHASRNADHEIGGRPPGNDDVRLRRSRSRGKRRPARWWRTRIGSATSTKSAVPSSKVTTIPDCRGADGSRRCGELVERGAERDRALRRDRRDLLVEARRVEIDLERRSAADPVVEQHDDAADVGPQPIGRGRHHLHGAPGERARASHARIRLDGGRELALVLVVLTRVRASRGRAARRARAARASVAGRADRSWRTPGTSRRRGS